MENTERTEGFSGQAHDLEFLRKSLWDAKEESKDPHFKLINPDEISDLGLECWDEFVRGVISQEEIVEYRDASDKKFREQSGRHIISGALDDSNVLLAAYLLNKFLARKFHKEKIEKKVA